MNRFMIILVAIGAVMANGHLANAQEKSLLGLLKQMPAGTNAVLAADLAQVRSSDIAKKNGWFNTTKGGIESGIDFLPDNCDQIVLASQMDFQTFQSAWTSGLLVVSPMPDLEYIRGMTQGTRDELSGQKLIVTSSDVYVFQAGQNLGTYIPANRQQLAAWLMGMKQGSQSQVSPYLASAIEQRGEATMVLSFDLNQLVSPAAILQRAQDAEILKSNQIDAQKFAQAVASVRGVTVSASFLDAIYADAKVDFGQDVGFLEPVAKQLILEVMQNHGVHLQNAADWQLHMGNDSIQLSGELSQNGLRRLISLFNTAEPQLTATPPANATPQSTPPRSPTLPPLRMPSRWHSGPRTILIRSVRCSTNYKRKSDRVGNRATSWPAGSSPMRTKLTTCQWGMWTPTCWILEPAYRRLSAI